MSRARLSYSIFANYVGRVWSIAAVYLFIPIYLKLLGIEAFAVINFQSVVFALLFFADAGLAAAVTREVARSSDHRYLANLLASVERAYAAICIAVSAGLLLLSYPIAARWLNADGIPVDDLARYMKYIAIIVGLQLGSTLFHGVLMGLQKQATANGLYIGFGVVRSALVLVPLYIAPELDVFFAWQLGTTLLYVFTLRHVAWRRLSTGEAGRFSLDILKGIRHFSLGMMAISVIAALNTQIDKLITSRLLSLADFGHYALASILAQAPTIASLPIALALLPRLTALAERGSPELVQAYHLFSFCIASLAMAVGVSIFLFAPDILTLWVGADAAAVATPVTRILVVGGVFLAMQLMPYHLAIAHGHSRTNVRLGIASLVVTIPLMSFLTERLGLIGAAIPWVLTNAVAFILLGILLTGRFAPGEVGRWFLRNALVPAVVCIGIGAGAMFARSFLTNALSGLVCGILAGMMMLFGCALALYLMHDRRLPGLSSL